MTNQEIIDELKQPEFDQALRALYSLYFENIVSQVVANGGNRDDGADIFQDAILVLVEKVRTGKFRGESSVKTFLSAIARNLWLFELRTRDRRKNREMSYSRSTESGITEIEYGLQKDNKQYLDELFGQIGAVCKRILQGFYYEEKSMKDLLTEFDFENEQVLRNKKSKCMKKVKELLLSNKSLMENLKPLSLYE